jgi:Uma2 family endonuclease
MSTVATKTRYTPEDLLKMPDGDRYELVDGELVERNVGQLTSWIGGEIHGRLREHCRGNAHGWVFPADTSYQCFPDAPLKVRRPDTSFIRKGRLPGEMPYEGHCLIAPDLAVEVVSPNDLAEHVEFKVQEYLSAGVRLVWVVYPESRTVHIFRQDGTLAAVRADGELDGEDVIPGFRCRAALIFPTVSASATADGNGSPA